MAIIIDPEKFLYRISRVIGTDTKVGELLDLSDMDNDEALRALFEIFTNVRENPGKDDEPFFANIKTGVYIEEVTKDEAMEVQRIICDMDERGLCAYLNKNLDIPIEEVNVQGIVPDAELIEGVYLTDEYSEDESEEEEKNNPEEPQKLSPELLEKITAMNKSLQILVDANLAIKNYSHDQTEKSAYRTQKAVVDKLFKEFIVKQKEINKLETKINKLLAKNKVSSELINDQMTKSDQFKKDLINIENEYVAEVEKLFSINQDRLTDRTLLEDIRKSLQDVRTANVSATENNLIEEFYVLSRAADLGRVEEKRGQVDNIPDKPTMFGKRKAVKQETPAAEEEINIKKKK